ncbi:MAG: aldehyde dehydrogenase family protein [Desulfobacterales bacterium]|jgi:aldehyde dehydrogenase (NAD+)|nr:aldehyde dehydrogenase family protein [Desulfobacterales bacterium]MDY0378596.1 aldehyde dehydrogenase family protein [Desulfobacterales bacterium]
MRTLLNRLGLTETLSGVGSGAWLPGQGSVVSAVSPIDGGTFARVRCADANEYDRISGSASEAFMKWRTVPAPRRGEIVRNIGTALRRAKADLGALITLETGKIRAEAEGEVQEMIDMADFAVGQSRMLYGLTMHSERPDHRMYEQWHPLGPVGVITAFNFPAAVWSWNALIALIAGNTVVWKPSSKALVAAAAIVNIAWRVLRENGLPDGIVNLVSGDRNQVGKRLLQDPGIPLVSATGSVAMGREVAGIVSRRLGKTILELGGNNAVIVTASADLNLAVRAIVFGAVGTAGQRCTTTRRAIVHESIFDVLSRALIHVYRQICIGDPRESETLMGPLIDTAAVDRMQAALQIAQAQGGRILYGGKKLSGGIFDAGTYVAPCICKADPQMSIVAEETFAPILYLMPYSSLDQAIAIQNAVPQGLSSAIFSNDLLETEAFLGCKGSDCGIANVNAGTSGAEIGGAFGGEKHTGGGREAGSDAWKAYMRRQTCVINASGKLPLAQGIRFQIDSQESR